MNGARSLRKNRALPIICSAVIGTIVLAGLWPFDFIPRNEATWLKEGNGIRFGRLGIAYGTKPVYGPQKAIRPGGPLSIELVIRPSNVSSRLFAQILTLYSGGNGQFFTLAQRNSSLILRAAPVGSDLRMGSPEIIGENVFVNSMPVFLTVTSQNGNTVIYVDGKETNSDKDFPILPKDPYAVGKLVFGNSPAGINPWAGELRFFAAYDRKLSADEVRRHYQSWNANEQPAGKTGKPPVLLYRFDEGTGTTSRNRVESRYDLSIPSSFHAPQPIVLRPPWREKHFDRSFFHDVAVNILGFVPFGFFFSAWLRNGEDLPVVSYAIKTAILGATVSLIIELLQIYLPTRSSSLTDFACNVLGTILGVYFFKWVMNVLGLN